MSDEHVCISNDMGAIPRRDRPFPCRRRGQHYASCEGQEDGTCRGCVPRSATNGYLCPVCYRRVVDALGRLGWLIAHLRSIDKAAQAIGERVDTSMERSILIPDPWLAADELMTALGGRVIPSTASIDEAIHLAHEAVARRVADLDGWLNTIEGAQSAVILVKRMGVALRRWPDAEATFRPIPYMQCPACGHPHLWRHAPEKFGDELRVVCGTPECGYVANWDDWSNQYAPIFEVIEKDMKRREREAARARKEAS